MRGISLSWFTHKSGGFDLGEVYRVHTEEREGEREARVEFKGGAFMVLTDEEDIAALLARLNRNQRIANDAIK